MKRLALSLSVVVAGLGIHSLTLASPSGICLFVGGGIDYLSAAKLNSTQINVNQISPFTYSSSINYSQKSTTAYSGRGALSYYFYRDPSKSYSFGVEGGYNYFAPQKSSVANSLNLPAIGISFPVNTTEKTNAWSTDLEAVYSQDLFIPNTTMFLKLGAGYESMTSNITNVVTNIPNALPASSKINNTGFGVAGGFGLQYNFTKVFGIRAEVDGLKGMKNIGYAQGLLGLSFSF